MKKTLILIALVLAATLTASLVFAGDHATVGPEKCKMCHKIQYESWAASKHAQQNPKVVCETCHGPGGDYWKPNVMKDPAAAKAAGLIAKPEKAFCQEKCHKANWNDAMLGQTHAHKTK